MCAVQSRIASRPEPQAEGPTYDQDCLRWIGRSRCHDQHRAARGAPEKPEVRETPNNPAAIRKAFKQIAKGRSLRCCYEAGPCGYVLQRQLTAMGVECQVVAPPLIPQKPGDRVKTDRRDAAKLARLLRSGDLTPITVPTEDQEAVRDLVRAREAARRNRTDARHRLTKFLLRHGQRYHASNWTKPFWAWVNHVAFEQAELTKTLQHYIDMALPRPADRRLGRSHRDHRRPRAFPRHGCSLELLAWHQHARRQGDRLRGLRLAPIRNGEPVHGLPRGCPQRAFERPETATRAAPSPSPATGVCDASSSRPRGHTVTTRR